MIMLRNAARDVMLLEAGGRMHNMIEAV